MRKVQVMSKIRQSTNFPVASITGVPGKDFLRKADLIDGEYYYGFCRNASCARWSEADQEFTYIRSKFGNRFSEEIKHPENDDGFDLFIPLYRCYPTEEQLCPGDIKE